MSRSASNSIPQPVLPLEAIRLLCRRRGVKKLEMFGSVLREDFNAASDVDLMVTFMDDDLGPWLSRLTELQQELEEVLHRQVDLVTRASVEQSDNYIRRNHILSGARVIYAG